MIGEQLIQTGLIVSGALIIVCYFAVTLSRPRLKPMSKQELTDLATRGKAEREAGRSNQPGGV